MELVIPIPNQLVIPIPVDFLLGIAAGYYVIGFILFFRFFRMDDDDPLDSDLFFAAIGALFWPKLTQEALEAFAERRENESDQDDTKSSEPEGDNAESNA